MHASITERLGAAALFAALSRARIGSLDVTLPDGSARRFQGRDSGNHASVELADLRFLSRLIRGGDLAFADGYLEGDWSTEDLYSVLSYALANQPTGPAARMTDAMTWASGRLRQAWPDNDLEGARHNVGYHYDLGNEFYRLWLDPTMSYSAACFDGVTPACDSVDGEDVLSRAQVAKWDRILDMIQPSRRDSILEIGCGWGGFAVHAARQAGCKVTALTLSEKQAAFARRRVEEEGVDDLVEVRLQDYRQVPERFDAIASIEMFEAVGMKWWPAFFGSVRRILEPRAIAAIQVITIAERSFEEYLHREDFIRRHVFPGGMLPSPERFAAAAHSAGLICHPPTFFGADYSRTLSEWLTRFETAVPDVRSLGFDERFIRMWRYYLEYCRVGFDTGNIDVMHIQLEG